MAIKQNLVDLVSSNNVDRTREFLDKTCHFSYHRITATDATDGNGNSTLIIACFHHNYEMVELLLKYQANVNKLSGTGKHPIWVTIYTAPPYKEDISIEIIKLLINRGASFDMQDMIDIAKKQQLRKIYDFLITL